MQSSGTFITNVQLVPSEELPRESALLQSSLLGKFEDLIRQHERTCAEKDLLEERLRVKSEECQQIKDELQTMKGPIQESRDKVATAESRSPDMRVKSTTLRQR